MAIETLKRLSDQGLDIFKRYIEDTRIAEKPSGTSLVIPANIFQSPNSLEIDKNIKIDTAKTFSDRYDMALYLKNTIPEKICRDFSDHGMWAWLALIFIDQLRRTNQTNDVEHYIPDTWLRRTRKKLNPLDYRHSVLMPVKLALDYEPEWCNLILKDRMDVMGDAMESCCGNQYNLKSKKLRTVILSLYYDKKTGKQKPGAFNIPKGTSGQGGVRRFNKPLRDRLRKTYDYEDNTMDIKTVIKHLGQEVKNGGWSK